MVLTTRGSTNYRKAARIRAMKGYHIIKTTIPIIGLSLTVLCHSTQASDNHRFFNTSQTLSFALSHSPLLKSAASQQHISALNKKNNVASFLPTIDLQSNHGDGHGPGSDYSQGLSSNAGINANLPIYTNGKNITNYRISQQQLNFDNTVYQQTKNQLINTIMDDYLDYSKATKTLTVQKRLYKLNNAQYKISRALYHQGLKPETDQLSFENQILSAHINVINAEQTVLNNKQRLITDMGLSEPGSTIYFKPLTLPDIGRQQQLNTIALNQLDNYNLHITQSAINNLNTQLKRRDYWPNISINTGASYGNPTQVAGFANAYSADKQWGWHAELQLKYNLFDGGRDRRNITISQEQGAQQLDTIDNQLLNDQQTLANAISNYQNQYKTVQLSRKLITAAKKNLRIVSTQYKAGKLQYLDLITAFSNLSNAESSYYNSRFQLEKDLYQYHFYKGDINQYAFNTN